MLAPPITQPVMHPRKAGLCVTSVEPCICCVQDMYLYQGLTIYSPVFLVLLFHYSLLVIWEALRP